MIFSSLPFAKACPFPDFILGSDLVVPIKIEVRMICFKIKCVFSYCTF